MSHERDHDAIVVGSGASGGWAALTLAESGARVLLLEAGPLLSGDHRVDRATHDGTRQAVQARCSAYEQANSHLFVDDQDNPYEISDGTAYDWFRGRQVGGRLHLWAGVALRMSDREFAGPDGGRSWPIRHRDLDEYYGRVERFLRVSGPDVPLTRGERMLAGAVARKWPERQVLPSPTVAAGAGVVLAAALRTGRVTLRPDAVVSHVELDDTGRRARGVVFADRESGVLHRAEAPVVVLAASAIESVRILLNSRTPAHPDGLGNDAGQLGAYFLDHLAGVSVSGIVPGDGDAPRSLAAPGFVPVCHIPDFGGGYGITAFAPETMPMNTRSAAWAARSGGTPFRMWALGEVLPDAGNRITLGEGVDAWGIPQARVRLVHGPAEQEMARDQAAEMTAMARAAGFHVEQVTSTPLPPGSSVHERGGAAMGHRRDTSVTDAGNRLWAAPNVLVADAACFPAPGWQNPTLTGMALAVRAADLLSRESKAGAPGAVTVGRPA